MAFTLVVAAASPGSPKFAVINFSNTPPTVVMTQGFENGNVVDCYGTLAAVAENSGNSVAIFDISTPALPSKTGSVDTGFQIGSISIYGSYVLAGEFEGSRVSLIDVSDPANPFILGISDCEPMLNIISSVALRSPTLTNAKPRLSAVVSGDNNSVILYFQGNPPTAAVPIPLLYNAWPSDFDGWTAAVANDPNAPGGDSNLRVVRQYRDPAGAGPLSGGHRQRRGRRNSRWWIFRRGGGNGLVQRLRLSDQLPDGIEKNHATARHEQHGDRRQVPKQPGRCAVSRRSECHRKRCFSIQSLDTGRDRFSSGHRRFVLHADSGSRSNATYRVRSDARHHGVHTCTALPVSAVADPGVA